VGGQPHPYISVRAAAGSGRALAVVAVAVAGEAGEVGGAGGARRVRRMQGGARAVRWIWAARTARI